MKNLVIPAGAVAALLTAATVMAHPASAVPLSKTQATPRSPIQLVAQHGGGGGRGIGGGGRGIGRGGGGGSMHFRGGSGPRFHGSPGARFRGGSGARYHGPRGGHHHHHHGPRFRGYYWPYYGYGAYSDYYYDDYGYDECAPLRRRAAATGSRYWWSRYYACIGD